MVKNILRYVKQLHIIVHLVNRDNLYPQVKPGPAYLRGTHASLSLYQKSFSSIFNDQLFCV